jgi:hypothetical protein
MEIYNYIISKVPEDVKNYIHEFENPETSFIVTKIQEIIKEYNIENMKKINRNELSKAEENKILTLQEMDVKSDTIKYIQQILKVIPYLYEIPTAKKKIYVGEFEKHYVEDYINYHTDLRSMYVSRGAVLLAMIVHGFPCFFKNNEFRILAKRFKTPIDNEYEKTDERTLQNFKRKQKIKEIKKKKKALYMESLNENNAKL